ncbi:thioredoxin domain-containing protein [Loigolactobacillus iwatensis]|uniref:thioredoxin domain-containing protein n=1 Tax=Loigolactobacillus iwatensis TaxID=1267156 RepID=UPI000F7E7B6B|nr:thioredoxin domain-containing protein [Loigolactobacillus iwatensis]
MSKKYLSVSTALNFGQTAAKHQVTAILNLGCPDSRQWYLANQQALFQAVQTGQIRLKIKFWNKPVADLANGNVANRFVNYAQPKVALKFITAVYAQQKDLNATVDVNKFLTTKFKANQVVTQEVLTQIDREIAAEGITSLPTVIFDDVRYSDDQLVPITQLLA